MNLNAPQTLMRIFLDKFQTVRHRPLYEHLVAVARERHMAGATVFEGIEGFGQQGIMLRDGGMWSLSSNREVIVEIVDETARIEEFLAAVEPLFSDAVVTLEKARVLLYRHRGEARP